MSDIERKKLQRQAINRRAYLKRIKNNIKNYSKNFETDDNNIKFINRLSNNYKNLIMLINFRVFYLLLYYIYMD